MKGVFEQPQAEENQKISGIRLRFINYGMIAIVLILSFFLLLITFMAFGTQQQLKKYTDEYIECQQHASDMQAGSDYLMAHARSFVVTGKSSFMDQYFEEVDVTRRRDRALESIRTYLEGTETFHYLSEALTHSNELMETECYAMRLACASFGYDISSAVSYIQDVELSSEDLALSPDEQQDKAIDLMFNEAYQEQKNTIDGNVQKCTEELVRLTKSQQEASTARLQTLLTRQRAMIFTLLIFILLTFILFFRAVLRPIEKSYAYIRSEQPLPLSGSYEFKYLANTYNQMYNQSKRNRNQLQYEATHDALTGVLNRGAFEKARSYVDKRKIAMLLIDVDYFKTINDTYGHEMGDRVLQKGADLLTSNFRSEDSIYRIGGDEFAILMVHADSSLTGLVRSKIMSIIDELRHPEDGFPPVTLSVGVAFSDRRNPSGDIYKDADTALYKVKEANRANVGFYE